MVLRAFVVFLVLFHTNHAVEDVCSIIDKLLSLVPQDKITELAENYAKTDTNFRKVLTAANSPTCIDKYAKIFTSAEFMKLRAFVKDASGGCADFNRLCLYFVFPFDCVSKLDPNAVAGRGFGGFLQDAEKLVNENELKKKGLWYYLANANFHEFMNKVMSPEAKMLLEDVANLPECLELVREFENAGVDISLIMAYFKKILSFCNL